MNLCPEERISGSLNTASNSTNLRRPGSKRRKRRSSRSRSRSPDRRGIEFNQIAKRELAIQSSFATMEAVGTGVPNLKLPVLRPRRSQISCRNSKRSLPIAAPPSRRSDKASLKIHESAGSRLLAAPSSAARKRDGRLFCSTEAFPLAETLAGSASTSAAAAAHEKVGVLLLNLGGPDSLQDVQPFLFNLFADPDIIRLPRLFRFLQRPLAQLISVARAPKSREGYASIGGGSPLRKITNEQAHALKLALKEKNLDVDVYVGMRYWHPFTEEAVEKIKKDNITKLVVLPLYPQFSISTSGSSIRLLQSIFREDAYFSGMPISIIESWYQREGYVSSMADLIEKELQSFSKPEEVMIFFSAHGVPVSYVEDAGDPYRDQMEDCINLIMDELKSRGVANQHTLAYQSRVGPVQWLKPYTDKVLVELGQNGVKSLLAVPVSFVSEHIETLEEIDMEYKHLALESGIENWGRVPALGCTSSFIADLADAVMEALPSASSASKTTTLEEETQVDLMQYAVNFLFGSLFAFFLLLSPKLISLFKHSPF